ncbi:MAG: NeuD/PglB/VioB family sugar acetyltransferase [Bdellovibrio sp.]
MKKIYLIGAGGHCHSCIDVIETEKKYEIAGIFDVDSKVGQKVLGYPIIGTDEDIEKYIQPDHYFLITVGQIKSAGKRKALFEMLGNLKAQFAVVVSPRAWVSPHSEIGVGTIVMHDALINVKASVGVNCIINTKALIEHDAIIESHCHISTAAVVNGNCHVKEGSFIGSNSVLKEGALVEKLSVLGAGAFHR